jgi:hypothetical protein
MTLQRFIITIFCLGVVSLTAYFGLRAGAPKPEQEERVVAPPAPPALPPKRAAAPKREPQPDIPPPQEIPLARPEATVAPILKPKDLAPAAPTPIATLLATAPAEAIDLKKLKTQIEIERLQEKIERKQRSLANQQIKLWKELQEAGRSSPKAKDNAQERLDEHSRDRNDWESRRKPAIMAEIKVKSDAAAAEASELDRQANGAARKSLLGRAVEITGTVAGVPTFDGQTATYPVYAEISLGKSRTAILARVRIPQGKSGPLDLPGIVGLRVRATGVVTSVRREGNLVDAIASDAKAPANSKHHDRLEGVAAMIYGRGTLRGHVLIDLKDATCERAGAQDQPNP